MGTRVTTSTKEAAGKRKTSRVSATSSINTVAKKVAKETNLEPAVVREAIHQAIRMGSVQASQFGFLTFNGILPLDLPNGLRIVLLPDLHAPAHHQQILWAVKQFLADYKPHILILIGDVADVFALSAWPKSPRIPENLQNEVDETRELIDELIEVSECFHCFVTMGNHEDRARRWLSNFGGKLQNLVGAKSREPITSFHEMLGYEPGDKVTFIYDLQGGGGFGGGIRINRDLKLIHGIQVKPRAGASPRGMTEVDLKSIVHGHTHRLGTNHREITTGTLRSTEIGMLVNPEHSAMGYANLLNNWHPGFAYGEIVDGKVHMRVVPIIQTVQSGRLRHIFAVNGKVYSATDR